MKKIKKMSAGGAPVDCTKKPGDPSCKRTYGKRGLSSNAKKAIIGTAAGVGALIANKKYGLVDKAKQALGMKKGGAIKKVKKMEMGGMTASTETCGPGRPCHKTNKKANNQRLKAAGVPRKTRRSM